MAFLAVPAPFLDPILGALILGVVSEWLRGVLVQYHLLVFGVVIVLTVIFAPHGVLELIGAGRRPSLAMLLANVRANRV